MRLLSLYWLCTFCVEYHIFHIFGIKCEPSCRSACESASRSIWYGYGARCVCECIAIDNARGTIQPKIMVSLLFFFLFYIHIEWFNGIGRIDGSHAQHTVTACSIYAMHWTDSYNTLHWVGWCWPKIAFWLFSGCGKKAKCIAYYNLEWNWLFIRCADYVVFDLSKRINVLRINEIIVFGEKRTLMCHVTPNKEQTERESGRTEVQMSERVWQKCCITRGELDLNHLISCCCIWAHEWRSLVSNRDSTCPTRIS